MSAAVPAAHEDQQPPWPLSSASKVWQFRQHPPAERWARPGAGPWRVFGLRIEQHVLTGDQVLKGVGDPAAGFVMLDQNRNWGLGASVVSPAHVARQDVLRTLEPFKADDSSGGCFREPGGYSAPGERVRPPRVWRPASWLWFGGSWQRRPQGLGTFVWQKPQDAACVRPSRQCRAVATTTFSAVRGLAAFPPRRGVSRTIA